VLDEINAFVFLIEDVPVRFHRGLAEEPTARALRRHAEETRQLSLAFGDAVAEGLVFRLAVETGEGGRVERVVFLALQGEEGEAACVWPVPLEMPAAAGSASNVQLRLLPNDGYAGPTPLESAARGAASTLRPAAVSKRAERARSAKGDARKPLGLTSP
jgi:hypothetical protein